MTRFRLAKLRLGAAALVALVLVLGKAVSPCSVVLEEPKLKEPMSLKAMKRRAQQAAGTEFWYQQYDTNAVGEAWRGSRHWVDRAGAGQTSDDLERELISTRIAGKSASEGRRAQMRLARARGQRLMEERLAAREQRQEPRVQQLASRFFDANALGERWHHATGPAEDLEQKLRDMKVGRASANEGRRLRMLQKREETQAE
mmetsp:Transcript_53243/g.127344  ORF Transcript_53243/g.127344 Transcript_53243/m.127344 type:complete len:201 (+) Transcript_53243:51-653(+)|eukprot:CAMPEP_0181404940 /NCGR_PEP_ID=MMETSP1110-20121109/4508_1 /TAXON_ID=174948 /ORGANISM="Symbiodinium sp., Strain CCMP421" /LENGTH=200 /DNA_ID=CAMNT_0023527323 /DNA_START=40 /DNA_END=642 /DNA_ORIENTATION=-